MVVGKGSFAYYMRADVRGSLTMRQTLNSRTSKSSAPQGISDVTSSPGHDTSIAKFGETNTKNNYREALKYSSASALVKLRNFSSISEPFHNIFYFYQKSRSKH